MEAIGKKQPLVALVLAVIAVSTIAYAQIHAGTIMITIEEVVTVKCFALTFPAEEEFVHTETDVIKLDFTKGGFKPGDSVLVKAELVIDDPTFYGLESLVGSILDKSGAERAVLTLDTPYDEFVMKVPSPATPVKYNFEVISAAGKETTSLTFKLGVSIIRLAVPRPEQVTRRLNPIKDAYVSSKPADKKDNFGALTVLSVKSDAKLGSPDQHRAFIHFDLSTVPAGATIISAELRLFMFDAPEAWRTYEVYRVTAGWGEYTITWDKQPVVAPIATSTTATGTTNYVWLAWDVTRDVAAFLAGTYIDYGWRISDSTEGVDDYEGVFRSREYTATIYDPKLVIIYILP